MPTPLNYQISEYDCGTATLRNALAVLFDRKKIPPCMMQTIHKYTLDACIGRGHSGAKGTSAAAIEFIASWFNAYHERTGFPITCSHLPPSDVNFIENSKLICALNSGAVAVVRCAYDVDHYILLTGIDGEYCLFWDSYHVDKPIRKKTIQTITDAPCHHNRRVHFTQMDTIGRNYYSLGALDKRECLVMYNLENKQD